jgi:monoamine oxidase
LAGIDIPKSDQPFALGDAYRHPGAISDHDVSGPRKRVCVIGAGMAGLTAAYELECCEHSVLVLEASNRPGGRVRTARFSDGTHAELGAMRIPANHHSTLHYVERFRLSTQTFINCNPAAKYRIRGEAIRCRDWEALVGRFDLRQTERRDPARLYESLMWGAMAQLSTEDKHEIFGGVFESVQARAFDAQTLWQFLRRWLSPEAIQYVGHATGMGWYERASFLEALVDYFGLFRIDSVQLVDGMDELPTALARHLGDSVRYGAHATHVDLDATGASVTWRTKGASHTEHFDYVVCALPAPCAAAIQFSPALPARQLEALRKITYASGAKTLLHCKTRPWEYVDGIFGGGSFTDLPIQQCWYPSDNAQGNSAERTLAFTGDDPEVAGGNLSTAPAEWLARDPEVSHSPAVLTGAYMWEANARQFAALPEEKRTALVLSDLEQLHPELPAEVDEVIHVDWDAEAGGGTYAFYAPGDYQRYYRTLREAFPVEAPRVFFAGEHLAVSHAWIQGAVQTGWEAARDVAAAEILIQTLRNSCQRTEEDGNESRSCAVRGRRGATRGEPRSGRSGD